MLIEVKNYIKLDIVWIDLLILNECVFEIVIFIIYFIYKYLMFININ